MEENAGRGRVVTFHGAFGSKADAVRKEREVGGFIRPRIIRGEKRWVVMSGQRGNPRGATRMSVRKDRPQRYTSSSYGESAGFDWSFLFVVGGIAVIMWLMGKQSVPTGVAMGGQALWFNDPASGGDSSIFAGSLPPGAQPPWRRATAAEQTALSSGAYAAAGGGLYVVGR